MFLHCFMIAKLQALKTGYIHVAYMENLEHFFGLIIYILHFGINL